MPSLDPIVLIGLVLAAVGIIIGAWLYHRGKYRCVVQRRSTTLDYGTGCLETRLDIVLEKPDWFALRRGLTVESVETRKAGYVKSATLEAGGESFRCRMEDSLWRPTTKIVGNLRDFKSSKTSAILMMESHIPLSAIVAQAPTHGMPPVLLKKYLPEATDGRIVRRSVEITKRKDVDQVRNYTETLTVPSASVRTLEVDVLENGDHHTQDPFYVNVSRSATLAEAKRRGFPSGSITTMLVETALDIKKDKTVVVSRYQA